YTTWILQRNRGHKSVKNGSDRCDGDHCFRRRPSAFSTDFYLIYRKNPSTKKGPFQEGPRQQGVDLSEAYNTISSGTVVEEDGSWRRIASATRSPNSSVPMARSPDGAKSAVR